MIEKLVDLCSDRQIRTQEYFYIVYLLDCFSDCKVYQKANQAMLENLFVSWFPSKQLGEPFRTLLGIELLTAYQKVNQTT